MNLVDGIILFYRDPYYWIYTACWVLLAGSEWIHSIYTRDSGKGAKNKYSTALIYFSILLLILIGFSGYIVPNSLTFKSLALPLFVLGVITEVAGLSLRWISVFTMGEAFSREIKVADNQRIVKTGPFAYIRHPNYLAGWLMFLSFGLIYGTWVSLVACALLGFLTYQYRIKVEESFLLKHLDGYATYCKEVKYRLIPFIY